MRRGIVTAISPLRIQLDGDTTPLPLTPESLVNPAALAVDDVVRCVVVDRRVVILGRSGGDFDPAVLTALAGDVADLAGDVAPLVALEPLLLRGVIPSSVVVGSGSASVAADGTVTYTGVSSVSLNDVFGGLGADIYEVVAWMVTSTGATVGCRVRSGGVDDSGASDYVRTAVYTTSSTGPLRSSASSNAFGLFVPTSAGTGSEGAGRMTVFNPGGATPTRTEFSLSARVSTGDVWQLVESCRMNTGAVDGLTLFASAGTMTGFVKVVKVA
jgi:hypothetical protein